MGKTRDLFKKIHDTNETFHKRRGMRKDRNDKDTTEEKEIKKRWQENTEGLLKKSLNDPDDHNDVVTHLQPDILECEVNWALGSITMNKGSGANGIPAVLFQILKDDAVKVLHSTCQQIWETQQWPQDWKKVSFHSNPEERQCQECSSYSTSALTSHTSKVMLKILQARLQQYMNCELPDVQEKAEKQEIKLPTFAGSLKKQESSSKTSISALLTTPKALTVWITTDCGEFLKIWEYQTTVPAS